MKVTDQVEQAVTAFVKSKFGIHLQSYQKPYLHDAIISACKKFHYHSPSDYLTALNQCKQTDPQLIHLIDAITVNESYFFRDLEQNQLLESELLPQIIHQHRENHQLTLRIWSAGCAKGQEIYTIAILLHKLLPDIDQWKIHLLATDINRNNLREAIKGSYSSWSMRATPESIQKQYFHFNSASIEPSYQVDEQLRKLVKFAYLNLSQDHFPSMWNETNSLDLILCRNVFIYLSQLEKPKIIDKFSACLNTDGILIFSTSDLINYTSPLLKKFQFQSREYFVKVATQQERETTLFDIDTTGTSTPTQTTPSITQPMSPDPQPISQLNTCNEKELLSTIQEKMVNGQWQDTIKLCDQLLEGPSPSPLAIQYKAKSLANIGQLDESANLCLAYITANPLDKHGYLIYSLVLIEQGEYERACEYLKKIIFIDSQFLEAYYHYGMLEIRLGMVPQGLAKLEYALSQVNAQNAHYIVHNTTSETYEHFANTIKQEILMYSTLRKDSSL